MGSAKVGNGGCIKRARSVWTVRRETVNGVTTSYRTPTEREREMNKERERRRRAVLRNMIDGLKAQANYGLPAKCDGNDVLKALLNEAGWIVGEDGTIYGRHRETEREEAGYGNFEDNNAYASSRMTMKPQPEPDLTLKLSLPN